MRLFVALNLPPEERARLDRAAAALRAAALPVRWVASDGLHLTLKFLGEVADSRVAETEAEVRAVSREYSPFELELGGLGAFPNLRQPRVIWMGLKAPPELGELARSVELAMEALGFPREERPFSPHLTLGRAERGARAADFRGLPALVERFGYSATVEAHTVDLMRSHLSPRGARYERLAAAPLAAPGLGDGGGVHVDGRGT